MTCPTTGFIIFHVSEIPMTFDISFSTGLLTFQANYQVEDWGEGGGGGGGGFPGYLKISIHLTCPTTGFIIFHVSEIPMTFDIFFSTGC